MMSTTAAVIVAHPDDETIWAGGYILSNRSYTWTICSLCRAGDPDRAPRFRRALGSLGATGYIGDLDDGPGQIPLENQTVKETVMNMMPATAFDLIITHSPAGEYTRHIRHEEAGRAVISLWQEGRIKAKRLMIFAYEDGGKKYLPSAIKSADLYFRLPRDIWQQKQRIITEIYGFGPESFEAKSAAQHEAFRVFLTPAQAIASLNRNDP